MKPYELLEVLAGKTWRSIDRFSRNRIHLGEDAITSNNLDAIASGGPACIVIEDTRIAESTKGCDFELWIGSSLRGWQRYAVQAKKIQASNGRYASLAHAVSGVLQLDILDMYASANRALPIYCFYNYSTEVVKWNCSLKREVEQLGCSVTPSYVVRDAITTRGSRNYKHIHAQPATLPWRCLLRCPNFEPNAANNPFGWPHLGYYFFPKLPDSLQRLASEQGSFTFDDMPDLFNPDNEFRPNWIGVLDIGGEGPHAGQRTHRKSR